MAASDNLRPLTVYLPPEEIERLEREATDEGRSGASAQIRLILKRRRDATDAAARTSRRRRS